MADCPQPPTDNVKAALRQLHSKFIATEDALEVLCKMHDVQYHAPTIDEAGRAKTTKRRRMMMSVLMNAGLRNSGLHKVDTVSRGLLWILNKVDAVSTRVGVLVQIEVIC